MASKKKKRRRFTPEYKAEVVALMQKGGKTAGQVARDLDLTETSVRAWLRQADIDERPERKLPSNSWSEKPMQVIRDTHGDGRTEYRSARLELEAVHRRRRVGERRGELVARGERRDDDVDREAERARWNDYLHQVRRVIRNAAGGADGRRGAVARDHLDDAEIGRGSGVQPRIAECGKYARCVDAHDDVKRRRPVGRNVREGCEAQPEGAVARG